MSDPKPLTDEHGDGTELERELLGAAQNIGLSAAEKQAIWASVALQALPAPAAAAASASVAPGAAGKAAVGLAPWLKGVLFVCGVGGVSTGALVLRHELRRPSALPGVASAVAAAASTPGSLAALASASPGGAAQGAPARDAPSPSDVANPPSTLPSPSAASVPTLAESKSALREESLAVLEIRRTLRSGDASGALRLLEQARQRFVHGALRQEREALSIEALAKSGARAAAAKKAAAFLRAHPKSPYAADVQSFQSP